MRIRLSLLALLPLALGACAGALQGEPADLHQIATPDKVPEAGLVQPLPGPVVAPGTFRAWIPLGTDDTGTRVEGHWITIPTTPPPEEVIVPTKPMPRAPKHHLGAKPATTVPKVVRQPTTPQAAPVAVPQPLPVLPDFKP